MKKKVLILSASPRVGGNSDILCNQFMLGAQESEHSVEKIYLQKEKLGYCMACGSCSKTKKCVQKDSGNTILEKMVDADVIVFSTPVYFYAMSGQLKILIDRTLPRYSELAGKAYLIATAADPTLSAVEGTVSDYRSFLRMTPNLKDSGHIFGLNAWDKGEIIGNTAMMQAYEAGQNV